SDILSCWRWKVYDMQAVITVSLLGDIFLMGNDSKIYWLQTDTGEMTQIAESYEQYQDFLNDDENIENWFTRVLVEKLIAEGKVLKENEVYSYKKIPVLGGAYSVENISPTDLSVHFAFSGQICEQIKDLPDGTKVNIKFEK
ncbi:DUF1851 domain-containing protein, partial [Nostoc sp. NIES-2111]